MGEIVALRRTPVPEPGQRSWGVLGPPEGAADQRLCRPLGRTTEADQRSGYRFILICGAGARAAGTRTRNRPDGRTAAAGAPDHACPRVPPVQSADFAPRRSAGALGGGLPGKLERAMVAGRGVLPLSYSELARLHPSLWATAEDVRNSFRKGAWRGSRGAWAVSPARRGRRPGRTGCRPPPTGASCGYGARPRNAWTPSPMPGSAASCHALAGLLRETAGPAFAQAAPPRGGRKPRQRPMPRLAPPLAAIHRSLAGPLEALVGQASRHHPLSHASAPRRAPPAAHAERLGSRRRRELQR